jgi:hypothetical protein
MRELARPRRPAEQTGSADVASHGRPVVQKHASRSSLSFKLATRLPAGAPLQKKEGGAGRDSGAASASVDAAAHADGVRAIAERGVAGSAGALPYLSVLQPAFGAHDLRGVRACVGDGPARAASAIGARAYTVGDRIAFREPPDLHTAAHEAAHVLQQRSGVDLPEGLGRAADRYEQHADAVADAVVDRRPVAPLLAHLGPRAGAADAVQMKEAGEEDADAIERAGKRANESVANNKENDTEMMINGASIFFRMMRTFFPEVLARWHFSGVTYRREYRNIYMERRGSDVAVTVGRDFVLGAKEHGLASRILSLEAALQMLEDGPSRVVASTASTGGPPTRAEAIKEAGTLFAQKAGFGVTSGLRDGLDEKDGYDARFWSEAGRVIVAKVEPWLAMSQMIAHLDDPVPMQGGGTTRWHFDCWEGAQVEGLYADWRTLSREEFNKKNSPLQVGFFSTSPSHYQTAVQSDGPGGEAYTRSDEPQMTRGPRGEQVWDYVKTPVGKPMAQVLDEAPVGSWIIWTNKDVAAKVAAFTARTQAGGTLTVDEQELWNRIDPWENENALKISKDQYAAFPFGVVDEKTIVQGMANIVFEPNPVPAGYIESNIYISAVRIPKEPATTT